MSHVRIKIPHSKPSLGREEAGRAAEVIQSGHIAQGIVVEQFEQSFARRFGGGDAACTSSGTAALHLSLLALEVGPGDEIILPSFVCSALLNAVRYVGATPVFAEIVPETYNIDPDDVKRRITQKTKAVIVPHLFGLSADLTALLALDVPLIEDCAQGIGATHQGKPVGTFGKIAVFSFYATKVITTGEGGMVFSASGEIIDRIRELREYDKRADACMRFNYKMTDIQAAIGLVQLNRLDGFVKRRRSLARFYSRELELDDFRLPPNNTGHIFYRYVIDLGMDAQPWIDALNQKGIECGRPIYRPLHRNHGRDGFGITDRVYHHTLSIPIYPSLSDKHASYIVETLKSAEGKLKRAQLQSTP